MNASENTFKVPKRQWKRWSPRARHVFNETYDQMLNNQHLYVHPKAAALPHAQWSTTAWNAAWIAADAVDEWRPSTCVEVDSNGREVAQHHIARTPALLMPGLPS